MRVGKEEYQDINKLLNKKLEEMGCLIAVHRGLCGGNIVENTIPAYELALRAGADMFETDIISSTDHVLYAFHDGTERRNLKTETNIKSMSSKEIDDRFLYNSIAHKTHFKVEKFQDICKYFANGELCNIDRAWDILPQVISKMKEHPNFISQAIIKAPVQRDVLDYLESCEDKVMFMPITYTMEEVETVLKYGNINTVGIEAIAKTNEDPLFLDENIKKIKSNNLFIWVNAITLDNDHPLYGNLDDNTSLLNGYDQGWGKLFEKGIDILQTDWPSQLSIYRNQRYSHGILT